MIEKFEIKGDWFLPSNRKEKVFGILNFDPFGETVLELYGLLSKNVYEGGFEDQLIILGTSNDNKEITLYNCYVIQRGLSIRKTSNSVKAASKYVVDYLFIGLHAFGQSDLKFNQITSKIFNLDEWLGVSGFDRAEFFESENEINLKYSKPKPIQFKIDNSTKGRFDFDIDQSGFSRYQKSVYVTQSVKFQVISEETTDFNLLLRHVLVFQNFLTLALYKSTHSISLTLSSKQHVEDYGDGVLLQKNIVLFFPLRRFVKEQRLKYNIEMLFDYKKIETDFPSIIKNWYTKYEYLEPAFDLVFEQFYSGNEFTVNTFLNLAQSAETFHSRVYDHPRMPETQYNKMKEDILKVVPAAYHKWLIEQFNFGNTQNLHSRLTEIIEKYSNKTLGQILGDKDKFILEVKHSRNYYTHYPKEKKRNVLKETDLYYLSEKLKLLLVCSFLVEIGFNNEYLSNNIEKVKRSLFNHIV